MALCYNVSVYNFYDHPVISFSDRPGQSLHRPCVKYGNHTVIVQSSCNRHDLCTKIVLCTCYVLVGSLGLSQRPSHFVVPNDYLKSCVDLTISVWCVNWDHAIYLRRVLGQFFKIFHIDELNKIVEAMILMYL